MAIYAIGDVQGCLSCLKRLLDRISADSRADQIWYVGDLVNRGPSSLETLRYIKRQGARVVLGNHDIHLMAVCAGARPVKNRDTIAEILDAPDRQELLQWLSRQPLMHCDTSSGWTMVHAGLVPQWSLKKALSLSEEASAEIQKNYNNRDFLSQLYGNSPDRWSKKLSGMARMRFIVNVLTRLRFCDPHGRVCWQQAGPPGTQPVGFLPWFELWPYRDSRIVFGHWSTLGAKHWGQVVSLDSGCVWGGELTAVRLMPKAPPKFYREACSAYSGFA